jgi:D-3-phosphoglycerate dehydrogenase
MSTHRVIITDFDFADVEIESAILERVGADVTAYQCKTADEVIRVAGEADAVINQYAPLTQAVIESLAAHCIAVGQYGIGVDTIAVDAATERGIMVINVPSFCEDEVAEHALALLLGLARRTVFYDRDVHEGIWDWSRQSPIFGLRGRRLGILGFGKIGRALARKVGGLEFELAAHDPWVDEETMRSLGVIPMTLNALLERSDLLSVHVPLTSATHQLLGERELLLLPRGAYLINASRGAVIDQSALYDLLVAGHLAGAALDVLVDEPPTGAHRGAALLELPNVCVTPHAAFYSEDSVISLRTNLATDVARALKGDKPHGFVNPGVWDHRREGSRSG